MKIAWFRPAPVEGQDDGDHLAAVIAALRAVHTISAVSERDAHDFVWQHARGAFDLCVYELDNTPRHQYMWPYLLNYPGVLALQSATVHDCAAGPPGARRAARRLRSGNRVRRRAQTRPAALAHGAGRVADAARAGHRVARDGRGRSGLGREHRGELARRARAPARRGRAGPARGRSRRRASRRRRSSWRSSSRTRLEVVARAVERVRADGLLLECRATSIAEAAAADVVVAVRWPLHGAPLVSAFSAMAAARPVIVAETSTTARWPALDPQTWRGRDVGPARRADRRSPSTRETRSTRWCWR